MSINRTNFSFATFLSVNNGDFFGSGFRIVTSKNQYIVTAKHVLYKDDNLLKELWVKSRNYNGEMIEAFDAIIDLTEDNVKTFDCTDIALVILNEEYGLHINSNGIDISHSELSDLCLFSDINISEEIYLVGFPSSLVMQNNFYENDRPLLRYGIIAGKNIRDNTFIIDSIAYYGVSGGPVVKFEQDNTVKIIGIVSRYIPFIAEWRNRYEQSLIKQDFFNSGYAVCEKLDDVISFIKKHEQI